MMLDDGCNSQLIWTLEIWPKVTQLCESHLFELARLFLDGFCSASSYGQNAEFGSNPKDRRWKYLCQQPWPQYWQQGGQLVVAGHQTLESATNLKNPVRP